MDQDRRYDEEHRRDDPRHAPQLLHLGFDKGVGYLVFPRIRADPGKGRKQDVQFSNHVLRPGVASQRHTDTAERTVQIKGRLQRTAAHPENTEAFIVR